jgi:hypothetical protein
MANRQVSPNKQNTLAANTALFVLAAICAAPALAATSSRIPCSDAPEITLSVAVETLIAETVGHSISAPPIVSESSIDEIQVVSTASLLVPRAEEAIRDAFAESDSALGKSQAAGQTKAVSAPPVALTKSKTESADADDGKLNSPMTTKLPGVSDAAMSRYKKQMFRQDI